ncbi:endonuclease/exonuclease/phosphatase family protein [Pseudidiomarina sediminum]|uniref:Endonuclease/exonuclease/phosphatase family protein n=1 Tax=Pseudidiomarina sediminum TaxID=431675 RepID=A0A432Z125_9GAMM|nr:endonuclease/exonuclease/phosphatase family protein [Pseudidiomarina sediminum]RUO69896.1 endonuclease/exonuclease/phosphatase family protein [Pseudidiomarina sediminum]
MFSVVAVLSVVLGGCDMPKEKSPEPVTLRVASFNVSMDASNYIAAEKWQSEGAQALPNALANQHPQIKAIAEIIQHTRPDVLLLNEFDYLPEADVLTRFQDDYLAVSQNGEAPIAYPYVYWAPVNTGRASPFDLNRDGKTTGVGDDAWGYGNYLGQYGMAILSRYPIDTQATRTFQFFKWKDLPGALRPLVPGSHEGWYSSNAWAEMPLSSKSHWDVVIDVKGTPLHILASHPTPPVFDGEENRNGRRNHDEIRFWVEYIAARNNDFIYDDQGRRGGLAKAQRFVIAGDLNASIESPDNVPGAIEQLLEHQAIQGDFIPESAGGAAHSPDNPLAAQHTAGWRKRADYVLPSSYGLRIIDGGVFWPAEGEAKAELVSDRKRSSDHRLVWIDIQMQ